jgi:hypothetical protein
MSRSSTSSSSGGGSSGGAGRFRGWLLTGAGILLLLAALEGTLRLPAVRDALPIRTHYHEPGVVVRVQTLEQLLAGEGHVDVLFAGSSIVRCNISPMIFDPLVDEDGQHHLVSFNAGMSGLWPAAVRLYLEDLWLPVARPRVVIQGIRYGELLPSARARSYEDISRAVVESSWEERGRLSMVRARLFERLRLLQYRGTLSSWMMRYRNGRPDPIVEDDVRVFTDPRGWTPRTPTLDVALARRLLRNEQPNGMLRDSREFRDALEAIRRSFRATRRFGAQYILVNVPEHAFRWSGPDGRERYETYLGALAQLARAEGFPFVDVTGGNPGLFSSPLDYSDYHHMSPAGARRFTTLLAVEVRSRYAGMLPPPVLQAGSMGQRVQQHVDAERVAVH